MKRININLSIAIYEYMMAETIVEVVKSYRSGDTESVLLVLPKAVRRRLGLNAGRKFVVKIDSKGRVIYEPLKEELK